MNVLADALDTIQHLCRKGSMFRLERPPRRPWHFWPSHRRRWSRLHPQSAIGLPDSNPV